MDAMLEDLWEEVRSDASLAGLRNGAARVVPGFGRRPTRVMVVADSPGAVESERLRPFTGTKGRILRDLMSLAGLRVGGDDANCWATYLIKYRCTPNLAWSMASLPHLRREWRLVGAPRMMVCVGAAAWQTLGPPAAGGLRQWAGKPLPMRGERYAVGMYSPGYGLQYPQHQDAIERQWEELGKFLRAENLL